MPGLDSIFIRGIGFALQSGAVPSVEAALEKLLCVARDGHKEMSDFIMGSSCVCVCAHVRP